MDRRQLLGSFAAAVAGFVAPRAFANGTYDVGADDREIRIGNISPYSGPASALGVAGHSARAYFAKINAEGGINGRQVKFISLDDGYNPARTIEQARKLVEQEQVLALFFPLGTAPNSAIHRYMNQKRVPQLFVSSGATKWGDPEHYPWTMGFQPNYQLEARLFAKDIVERISNPRVGVLYQNDDYGKDYVKGFREQLGARANDIIAAEVSYEVTDPTVSSQIVQLKGSGANVFFNVTTPKFAVQAMSKAAEIDWKPAQYLNSVSNSAATVMRPAGKDATTGVISCTAFKDPSDPRWQKGREWEDYAQWLDKYYPNADRNDITVLIGYTQTQAMVQVLRQAGDNLTRSNVMQQAANLDLQLPMLVPGVRVKTSKSDFFPIEQTQFIKYDGQAWVPFGELRG